jgi:hypothetical protein
MGDLEERINIFYDNCLDVNASWRNFTNQLALLNTFGILEDEDFAFIVNIIHESEEFEDERAEMLSKAVGSHLATKRIPIDLIDSCLMCETLEETGYDSEQFAEFAAEAGVPRGVIDEFLKQYDQD